MNLRTRLALTLLVSALPEKTIDGARVAKVTAALARITDTMKHLPEGAARVDIRDVLMALLDESAS
jgi:hypothetical protein